MGLRQRFRHLAWGLTLLIPSCVTTESYEHGYSSYQIDPFAEQQQEEQSIADSILKAIDIEGGIVIEEKELWCSIDILGFGLRLGITPVSPIKRTTTTVTNNEPK